MSDNQWIIRQLVMWPTLPDAQLTTRDIMKNAAKALRDVAKGDHAEWLTTQLEAWPVRIDAERTCNAEYLIQEAAKALMGAPHVDDVAVDAFAVRMKAKLTFAREKGRSGWDDPAQCSVETLRAMLHDHLAKGDPIDVANFCMMLDHYGASTVSRVPKGMDPIRDETDAPERNGEPCWLWHRLWSKGPMIGHYDAASDWWRSLSGELTATGNLDMDQWLAIGVFPSHWCSLKNVPEGHNVAGWGA